MTDYRIIPRQPSWSGVLALYKAADAAAEWITNTRSRAQVEGTSVDTLAGDGAPKDRGKREVRAIRAAQRKIAAMLSAAPAVDRQAVVETIMRHIRVDATGLAPAVVGHYIFGFEEAADAILALFGEGE
jgi:hypothetical protein